MTAILGCIADDFTGATEVANVLTRGGMRTVQTVGVPDEDDPALPRAEALVVALDSRTIPAAEAVAQSLAGLAWLRAQGCRQFLFKYCSTFDSTDAGNIGPVAEALLDALGAPFAIACPALPENGRTVFNGHLFVNGVLLSESPMKDHPLTPMRDANLVRVLQRQCLGRVGLVPYAVVRQGAGAIREACARLAAAGVRLAIADAAEDAHVLALAEACRDHVLVTGGSGIALGLPANLRRAGIPLAPGSAATMPRLSGHALVIAGSCSAATQRQVAYMRGRCESLKLDPVRLAAEPSAIAEAVAWAVPRLPRGPVMIYSTASPEEVCAAQGALGREHAAALVEGALAAIARQLVDRGVRRLVVAGGETSSAVVSALDVCALAIGPQIDPGVPWTVTVSGGGSATPSIALALKSGNFGAEDFFARAFAMLEGGQQQ